MTLPELTPSAKRKIELYKQKRLEVLRDVTFTNLLSGRFFLSGELTTISELVCHRLDEHFSNITSSMFDELCKQFPDVKQIGYLTSDPVFDNEWDDQLNKFIVEFSKTFTIDGQINWQKLSEIPSQ
ncbi:MAG: hypothetical protein RBS68_04985 [Anaerolineales bacterium]|jgi:hypothetical protein|nr:hypothetical protein [Anaerolineales bacterium]